MTVQKRVSCRYVLHVRPSEADEEEGASDGRARLISEHGRNALWSDTLRPLSNQLVVVIETGATCSLLFEAPSPEMENTPRNVTGKYLGPCVGATPVPWFALIGVRLFIQ